MPNPVPQGSISIKASRISASLAVLPARSVVLAARIALEPVPITTFSLTTVATRPARLAPLRARQTHLTILVTSATTTFSMGPACNNVPRDIRESSLISPPALFAQTPTATQTQIHSQSASK